MDEVLVEVVDVLDHAVGQVGRDADVVEDREVLDELAEADAAGVRADGHPELRREQDHRERLVHASEPARVDLAERRSPRAWRSCLNITRLWTCSPVATRIGAIARAIAA